MEMCSVNLCVGMSEALFSTNHTSYMYIYYLYYRTACNKQLKDLVVVFCRDDDGKMEIIHKQNMRTKLYVHGYVD